MRTVKEKLLLHWLFPAFMLYLVSLPGMVSAGKFKYYFSQSEIEENSATKMKLLNAALTEWVPEDGNADKSLAYVDRGQLFMRYEYCQKGFDDFNSALAFASGNFPVIYMNRGAANACMLRYDAALRDYAKAAKDPDPVNAS